MGFEGGAHQELDEEVRTDGEATPTTNLAGQARRPWRGTAATTCFPVAPNRGLGVKSTWGCGAILLDVTAQPAAAVGHGKTAAWSRRGRGGKGQ